MQDFSKRRIFQIREVTGKSFTAGGKAVEDVNSIATRCGVKTLMMCRLLPHNFKCIPQSVAIYLAKLFAGLQYWVLSRRIPNDGILLMQHPIRDQHSFMKDPQGFAFINKLKAHGVKILTLIHDVQELRPIEAQDVAGARDATIWDVMRFSDHLIVHNHRMAEWFVQQSFPPSRITELGIFDYLSDVVPTEHPTARRNVVSYAGTLYYETLQFLGRLQEITSVEWHLYGPNYNAEKCAAANVQYRGMVKPALLPGLLTDGFGLVWYGSSIDACDGVGGEYSKFINPHKLSLFLASGLPVIVWRPTYSAEFVLKHDVGIVIDSLRELPEKLSHLSMERYQELCLNARRLGAKIREGAFLSHALAEAVHSI